MLTVRQLKQTAKTAMRGEFLCCVLVSCLPVFAIIAAEVAREIFLFWRGTMILYFVALWAAVIFLIAPLFAGALSYFYALCGGKKENPAIAFSFFGNKAAYTKCVSLAFSIGIRSLLVGLLALLPSSVFSIFSNPEYYSSAGKEVPANLAVIGVLAVVLKIAGWIVIAAYLLRFYTAPFFLIAAPDMPANTILILSKEYANRFSVRFAKTVLSFSGWILLSVFVIPLIFTVPYFMAGYVISVKEVSLTGVLNLANQPAFPGNQEVNFQ